MKLRFLKFLIVILVLLSVFALAVSSSSLTYGKMGDIFLLDQFLVYHPLFVFLGGLAAILAAARLPKKPMLFLYLLFILYMTLYVREPQADSITRLKLFWSVREALKAGFTWNAWSQIINNILLFIPFGFILYSIVSCPQAVLVSLFLSAVIELLQYFFGLGVADYDDVVWNTLGGAVGMTLGMIGTRLKNAGLKSTLYHKIRIDDQQL